MNSVIEGAYKNALQKKPWQVTISNALIGILLKWFLGISLRGCRVD
jgi:hypothetical protein